MEYSEICTNTEDLGFRFYSFQEKLFSIFIRNILLQSYIYFIVGALIMLYVSHPFNNNNG